eukprot:PLAT324.1.p1 GENE.PLAT324.1~~PLAT324.1.p1  ORF type:complete len:488 (+),score=145.14 PLAT324.1:65-1528(+)
MELEKLPTGKLIEAVTQRLASLEEENARLRAEVITLREQLAESNRLSSQPSRQGRSRAVVEGASKILKPFIPGKYARGRLKAKMERAIVDPVLGRTDVAQHPLREYNGHRDIVWEVTTNESYLASASADGTARLWSLHSSEPLLVYRGHRGSVNSIRFHPSGEAVCTASGDHSVHIWRLPHMDGHALSGAAFLRRDADGDEGSVGGMTAEDGASVLSEEGSALTSLAAPASAGSGSGGAVASFDAPPPSAGAGDASGSGGGSGPGGRCGGRVLLALTDLHDAVLSAADWLAGHELLVTASWDKTGKLWDIGRVEKRAVQTLTGHEDKLLDVHTHPTVQLLATASADRTCRLWDSRAASFLVGTLSHKAAVTSAVFSLDGQRLLTSSDDRAVKIWDVRDLREPLDIIHAPTGLNRIALSSQLLAVPCSVGQTCVYDLRGNRKALLQSALEEGSGHRLMVCSAAWSPDESQLFTAGLDQRILAWDVRGC